VGQGADAPERPGQWPLPPAGIDHSRSGVHLGPRPCAEFKIVGAVFRGLLVLELVSVEKPALAIGQGTALDRFFQRVDITDFQREFAAIEVGCGKPRAFLIERFHERLQLGMLAPDEFRAFAFFAGLGGFDICVLIEAHFRGSFPSWLERRMARLSDRLVWPCVPPLGGGLD